MAQFLSANEPEVYSPKVTNGSDAAANFAAYRQTYDASIADSDAYWREQANTYITWFHPFDTVMTGGMDKGDVAFFTNGKLNVSYNCIDRHIATRGDQNAVIWEGNEIGERQVFTYKEVLHRVCQIANALKSRGVKKGDVVTIYMPMVPEVMFVMLACTRIGAVHSVVFAGFSADSLRDRILDCDSRFLVTCNEGRRGPKVLDFVKIYHSAVAQCNNVEAVFVFSYPGSTVMKEVSREVLMDELLPKMRGYCPVEWMDSEDPMFILYTSGSTGKPKGVLHTTGGYIVNAALTTKNTFDIQDGDIYCCAADAGWITGHTYIVYGPLALGTTTVMFESLPTYPDEYRYWNMIQSLKITQFYTSPTAIRALMRCDAAPIAKFDLSSLRVLGTVGEPINPEAWKWYYTHVGREKVTVADTYWQTETGAHICCNFPGATPMKPGSCTLPYPGIDFVIIDPKNGEELLGNDVEGVLCVRKPWPSMARSVHGDHDRYLNVYTRPYPGLYFTGDGARRDADGFYWITGRVDDVINPCGHRLGTAEVESALVAQTEVAEAAVVGYPHEVKGEGIACVVVLVEGVEPSPALTKKLQAAVATIISPIARPDIVIYGDLPKTRSGKIMRRILRKVAAGEDNVGDVTTLADPTAVDRLKDGFKDAFGR